MKRTRGGTAQAHGPSTDGPVKHINCLCQPCPTKHVHAHKWGHSMSRILFCLHKPPSTMSVQCCDGLLFARQCTLRTHIEHAMHMLLMQPGCTSQFGWTRDGSCCLALGVGPSLYSASSVAWRARAAGFQPWLGPTLAWLSRPPLYPVGSTPVEPGPS